MHATVVHLCVVLSGARAVPVDARAALSHEDHRREHHHHATRENKQHETA